MGWHFRHATAFRIGLLASALAASGCGVVPQRRLEDARVRIRALQAENEQLRDVVLNVRSKNRDLAARALEDARRVRALEEANQRLEQSILAYQDETKAMAALLEQLRTQVRLVAGGSTTISLRERLGDAVAATREARFDPGTMTIEFPASAVFDEETGALTSAAQEWLDAVGAALRADAANSGNPSWRVEISAEPWRDEVVAASNGVDLGAARMQWALNKLRSRVESASGLDPELFAVRPLNATEHGGGGDVIRAAAEPRVRIRLRPLAGPGAASDP